MVAGRLRYSSEEVEMEVVVVVGGGGLFEDEDEEEEEEVVVEAAVAVDGLLPFKSGLFFSELLFPADLGRLELGLPPPLLFRVLIFRFMISTLNS